VDISGDSGGKAGEKLWVNCDKMPFNVDNPVFSVDNPVVTVYKIPPNLWRTWGFRAPDLWIICG
jgi:hypothetical protein